VIGLRTSIPIEAAQESGQRVPVRGPLLVQQRACGEEHAQRGTVSGAARLGEASDVLAEDDPCGSFSVDRIGLARSRP